MQRILDKNRFNKIKLYLLNRISQYSQKIKYKERLDKAVPIMNVFLIFSFLYLFSLLSSYIESFIHMNVSFGNSNNLSSETVLNVWSYHPYIEDLATLKKIVYYKAQEKGINSFQLLSTEGLKHLPIMLIRDLIAFIQAWNQYEAQVLSSGAPPESDIIIKQEKFDEVNEAINTESCKFYASLGVGAVEISITYTEQGFNFSKVYYSNNG